MGKKSLLNAWQGKSLELLHQNVEEVLRSYRHSSDILSELLQNSVDACLRKKEIEKNYSPKINIEIDSIQNMIIVEDNGEGIPHDKLYDIIIPGGSLKKLGTTYGYKGYGLTFLAFISKEINIKTLHNGKPYEIQFNNLFDWLLNPSKNKNNLQPTIYKELNLSKDNLHDSFTKISLKLPIGRFKENFSVLSSFDDFFEWVKEKKILEFVLRTRTAIGNVKVAMNEKSAKIDFKINLDGDEFEIPYKFLEPLESTYMKSGRICSLQEYIDNTFCEPKLGNKSYRGLYEIKKDIKIGKNKPVFFNVKIYICGRTAITKLNEEFQLTKISNKINENFNLNTGVYLSIDGLPTGIKIDNWASKGASWQRYFVLVDILDKTFSEQLDSGRKGISNYFASKIVEKIEEIIIKEKFETKCTNPYTLQKLSKYLYVKDDIFDFLDEENSNDIESIIKRWDNQEDISFELKSIKKVPIDENAVIVIFYELIIRNIIKGYHTLFISSQAKYDVGFKYYFENVTEKDIYNEKNNPLGLNSNFLNKRIPQKKLIGEFKIRLEDLLYDFDKNIKDINELDIAIVWDFSEEKINELEGIIREENPYGRKYYGVTHILTYRNKDLPIICLKELIDKLKE